MFPSKIYWLFRVYFWVCVAMVGLYLVLSVLFYSIGSTEFWSFQELVKSNPLTYVVLSSIVVTPFLLGSFLTPKDE